jgi:hypothetical protein
MAASLFFSNFGFILGSFTKALKYRGMAAENGVIEKLGAGYPRFFVPGFLITEARMPR